MKQVPNLLTLIRLLLVPVFVVLMYSREEMAIYYAVAVFVVASLTDFLDGWIARKYHVTSDFGKLFDPIADKVLVMAALVMLVAERNEFGHAWVPAWMVILVIAREFWVTGLRALAGSKGIVIPAGSSGKIKSVLQMIAIVALLLNGHHLFDFKGYKIMSQYLGEQLLLFSILISYWGGTEYTVRVLSIGDSK